MSQLKFTRGEIEFIASATMNTATKRWKPEQRYKNAKFGKSSQCEKGQHQSKCNGARCTCECHRSGH